VVVPAVVNDAVLVARCSCRCAVSAVNKVRFELGKITIVERIQIADVDNKLTNHCGDKICPAAPVVVDGRIGLPPNSNPLGYRRVGRIGSLAHTLAPTAVAHGKKSCSGIVRHQPKECGHFQ